MMTQLQGAPTTLRLLRCVVAGQVYGLAMAYVDGIQPVETLQGQPGPQGLLGFLPGNEPRLPVFSLAARLSQPQPAAPLTGHIVVLQAQARPWALYVEHLEGVIQVAQDELCALPAMLQPAASRLFNAVLHYENTLLLSLAPAGLHPYGVPDALPLFHPVQRTVSSVPPAPEAQAQILSFTTLATAAREHPWHFALSLSQVSQILPAQPLRPVPGTAATVMGLTWWRDAPLAVLDLSQCLGGPVSLLQADGRLLVARAASMQAFVGFPIRPEVHRWRLPLAHRPSVRHLPLQRTLMRGQFDLERTTLVIPDIDGIMLSQEILSC